MLLSLRGVRSCRDEDSGDAGGLGSGEGPAAEALAGKQVMRRRPAPSRAMATSRSFTAAGTMAQARPIRLPRSVFTARQKP
jgi:hypothetical protein